LIEALNLIPERVLLHNWRYFSVLLSKVDQSKPFKRLSTPSLIATALKLRELNPNVNGTSNGLYIVRNEPMNGKSNVISESVKDMGESSFKNNDAMDTGFGCNETSHTATLLHQVVHQLQEQANKMTQLEIAFNQAIQEIRSLKGEIQLLRETPRF
jgi:hypothetical protein